jgi:hypothetical protein
MKKEMVVAMAHEASPDMTWYAAIENPDQASPGELAFLIRFAALVEQYTHTNSKARWYQEGVEAEREACAQTIESLPGCSQYYPHVPDIIRERSST